MRSCRSVLLPMYTTLSIVARDSENGDPGIAVASKFLAVGSSVPWAAAEVGAIATQSYANTSYGPRGLALMEEGLSAQEVVERVIQEDEGRDLRQVGVVDAHGRAAAYSGASCLAWAGHIVRADYACQGNILTGPETLQAMATAFEKAQGQLVHRLVAALVAGDKAGGDRRGRESAALLVVRNGAGYGGFNDIYVDLRLDDHPEPISELARLLELHRLFLGSSDREAGIAIDTSLLRELQGVIKRLAYYDGSVSGYWDTPTQQALQEFIGMENLNERVDITNRTIDPPALEYIRARFSR